MGQLATPYSKRRCVGVLVLSMVLLVPTLLVATVLTRTSIEVRADTYERPNVATTVEGDDGQTVMSRALFPQSLAVNNRVHWPLVQVAAGVGILLLVMIGLPVGCRLTKIGERVRPRF